MAEAVVTVKELRGQSEAELAAQLDKLRQEMWQTRMKVRDGALQQHHLLSRARRQVAQIQTILRERRGEEAKRSAERHDGKR